MDAVVADALAAATPAHVAACGAAVVVALALKFAVSDVLDSIRCRHIPCPAGRLPLLGHFLMLLRGNVWDTFTRLAQQYGSIYRMHVLGRVFIVVADPSHIKHVLSNIKNYRKDRGTYEVFDCLLGTGIVTSEGERWHRLRRELAPTFKLEILEDVARAAEDVTVRLYAELDRACESGETVDMAEHFRKLTLQVIALAVLGCTPDESDSQISDLYMPIIDECNDRIWYPHRIYLPTPAWWAHNRLVRNLNMFLEDKVRSRWAERERRAGQSGKDDAKDILDRILAGVDPVEFRKDGVRDLRDGLKTFLFAGHDTTSCMLTWTLWELMKAPGAMEAAVQEARAFFDQDQGGVATADFETVSNGLPYLFNCLRETLRLRSPVPVVTREIAKADEIGGVAVPAGAVALICMDAVHKRADLWPQGDTDVFRPTRCASSLVRHRYSSLPHSTRISVLRANGTASPARLAPLSHAGCGVGAGECACVRVCMCGHQVNLCVCRACPGSAGRRRRHRRQAWGQVGLAARRLPATHPTHLPACQHLATTLQPAPLSSRLIPPPLLPAALMRLQHRLTDTMMLRADGARACARR